MAWKNEFLLTWCLSLRISLLLFDVVEWGESYILFFLKNDLKKSVGLRQEHNRKLDSMIDVVVVDFDVVLHISIGLYYFKFF